MKKLFSRIRLFYHCLKFIKDPTQSDEILKAANAFAREQDFDFVTSAFRANQRSRQWDINLECFRPGKNKFEPGTLGEHYLKFMTTHGLKADFFQKTSQFKDLNLNNQIRLHLRSTHDIWHVLTGFDIGLEGEIGLQGFMLAQLRFKFSVLILVLTLIHCLIYKPEKTLTIISSLSKGWTQGLKAQNLLGIHWQTYLDTPLEQLRQRLSLSVA